MSVPSGHFTFRSHAEAKFCLLPESRDAGWYTHLAEIAGVGHVNGIKIMLRYVLSTMFYRAGCVRC